MGSLVLEISGRPRWCARRQDRRLLSHAQAPGRTRASRHVGEHQVCLLCLFRGCTHTEHCSATSKEGHTFWRGEILLARRGLPGRRHANSGDASLIPLSEAPARCRAMSSRASPPVTMRRIMAAAEECPRRRPRRMAIMAMKSTSWNNHSRMSTARYQHLGVFCHVCARWGWG